MKNKRNFWVAIGTLSLAGMALRLMGIWFEGVDYRDCLLTWYNQLKEGGGLSALTDYNGIYNLPYISVLGFLTYLPIPPIISIKMFSILFDYLEAGLLAKMMMFQQNGEQKYLYGVLAYGLVLCNPLAVINSGYLAQSESIWVCLALFAFWYIWQEKPIRGMMFMGFALAMKLQSIFIMPILLIIYFYKKKFSILHLLWIPVAVQVLCIPAFLVGCDFDAAWKKFFSMLGEYPFLYYYYPNIWTYFQNAPYYIFGKLAIIITFMILLVFAVLFVQAGRKHNMQDYMEYIAWTTMTCAMFLPCMHERYNYIAEILLPLCAIHNRKLRVPAVILVILSMQCNGQSYLGWEFISHYGLAAGNLAVYFYLTWYILSGVYKEYTQRLGVKAC